MTFIPNMFPGIRRDNYTPRPVMPVPLYPWPDPTDVRIKKLEADLAAKDKEIAAIKAENEALKASIKRNAVDVLTKEELSTEDYVSMIDQVCDIKDAEIKRLREWFEDQTRTTKWCLLPCRTRRSRR